MNTTLMLDVLVKSTIILVFTAAFSFLFRKGSAATRHVIWTIGILCIVALPLLSMSLPSFDLKILPELRPPSTPPAIVTSPPVPPTPMTDAAIPPPVPEAIRSAWTRSEIMLVVWLGGALFVWLRRLVGKLAIRGLLRRASPIRDARTMALLNELTGHFAIGRKVALFICDREITPMTVGIGVPKVLLPQSSDNWPEERLRFVLSHELAHVKRQDVLLQLPIHVACSLHWFNPMIWIARHRLMIERERACDDFVLNAGARPEAYADHLLNIARSVRHKPNIAFAGICMANRSQLETRLLSILDGKMNRRTPNRIAFTVVIALALITLLPLASIRLRAQTTKELPKTSEESARSIQDLSLTKSIYEALKRAFERNSLEDKAKIDQLRAELEALRSRSTEIQPHFNELTDSANSLSEHVNNMLHDDLTAHSEQLNLKDFGIDLEHHLKAYEDAVTQGVAGGVLEGVPQGTLLNPDHLYADLFSRHFESEQIRQDRLEQALGPMIQALQDSNADVRRSAAWAIGELRDRRGVDALIAALSDADADTRRNAATALGSIRDKRAVDALVAAVKDPSPTVRKDAILALGELRTTEAIGVVVEAMKDSDPGVRKAAVQTLPSLVRND